MEQSQDGYLQTLPLSIMTDGSETNHVDSTLLSSICPACFHPNQDNPKDNHVYIALDGNNSLKRVNHKSSSGSYQAQVSLYRLDPEWVQTFKLPGWASTIDGHCSAIFNQQTLFSDIQGGERSNSQIQLFC